MSHQNTYHNQEDFRLKLREMSKQGFDRNIISHNCKIIVSQIKIYTKNIDPIDFVYEGLTNAQGISEPVKKEFLFQFFNELFCYKMHFFLNIDNDIIKKNMDKIVQLVPAKNIEQIFKAWIQSAIYSMKDKSIKFDSSSFVKTLDYIAEQYPTLKEKLNGKINEFEKEISPKNKISTTSNAYNDSQKVISGSSKNTPIKKPSQGPQTPVLLKERRNKMTTISKSFHDGQETILAFSQNSFSKIKKIETQENFLPRFTSTPTPAANKQKIVAHGNTGFVEKRSDKLPQMPKSTSAGNTGVFNVAKDKKQTDKLPEIFRQKSAATRTFM